MNSVELNKGLGYFSIVFGLAETIFAPRIAQAVGGDQASNTLRVFGIREIATGVGILADPRSAVGPWARVGGDLLDAAVVGAQAFRPSNPRKTGAYIALGLVAGALLVDLYAARATPRN